mgnify:CR=1 FL=1
MKFANDLDLLKSAQLVNALLHKAATASIDSALSVEGQIGYDTTLDVIKYFDGSSVQTLLRLADVLNDNTLGGGSASTTKPPSQSSVKSYVDAALTGVSTGLNAYPTLFDAAAASTFPSDYTAGKWYRVTTAGTVLGVVLEVGDTIYPTQTSPSASNASHWYVAQANVGEASNSVFGFIKTATLSELQSNDSGAANKAITVSALNSFFASRPIPRSYVETVNLTNGTVGITHNLGTQNWHIEMTDASGKVAADATPNGNNAINIASKVALSSVKVVITGIY